MDGVKLTNTFGAALRYVATIIAMGGVMALYAGTASAACNTTVEFKPGLSSAIKTAVLEINGLKVVGEVSDNEIQVEPKDGNGSVVHQDLFQKLINIPEVEDVGYRCSARKTTAENNAPAGAAEAAKPAVVAQSKPKPATEAAPKPATKPAIAKKPEPKPAVVKPAVVKPVVVKQKPKPAEPEPIIKPEPVVTVAKVIPKTDGTHEFYSTTNTGVNTGTISTQVVETVRPPELTPEKDLERVMPIGSKANDSAATVITPGRPASGTVVTSADGSAPLTVTRTTTPAVSSARVPVPSTTSPATPVEECQAAVTFSVAANHKDRAKFHDTLNTIPAGELGNGEQLIQPLYAQPYRTPKELVRQALIMPQVARARVVCP